MSDKSKWLDSNKKDIIDEAYHACMNHRATAEQELIWRLANAVNCARNRLLMHDEEAAKKILYEHDYTIGTN